MLILGGVLEGGDIHDEVDDDIALMMPVEDDSEDDYIDDDINNRVKQVALSLFNNNVGSTIF